MSQAVTFLTDARVDLIVCTIVFDESKMFDLLRLIKAAPEWEAIPFLCARVRPHILRSQTSLEAAALTCRILGAEAFLDIADYKVEQEREMRSAIERHLKGGNRGSRWFPFTPARPTRASPASPFPPLKVPTARAANLQAGTRRLPRHGCARGTAPEESRGSSRVR